MTAKKTDEPTPTAADLTAEAPAAKVDLRIGNKVTFDRPGGDDIALGTIVGLREGEALVQWNSQEAWMSLKDLTVQP